MQARLAAQAIDHPGEAAAPAASLAPHHRLTLALVARGYSPSEIAGVRRVAVVDVLIDLRRAVDLLNAATVRDAVAAASHHGLLA